MDAFAARQIVESLRDGGVPRTDLGRISVGRESILGALIDDLAFIANGGYKTRFLIGDWGSGKTHVLSRFAERGREVGFAVSHVELHAKEMPLQKPEIFNTAVMRNIVFPGGNPLEDFFETWAEKFPLSNRKEIDEWLRLASPSIEVRSCLRSLLGATSSNRRSSMIGEIVRWLSGGPPSHSMIQDTGIRSIIKPGNAADVLTSFLRFIVSSGSKGTLLFLDEAEAITSLTSADKRDEANRTLRRILDNTDGRSHVLVLLATTRKFVDDPHRGAKSYPALWQRLREVAPSRGFNPRSTILHLPDLKHEEFGQLAERIAELHGMAYGWTPPLGLVQPHVSSILVGLFGDSMEGPPRPFVRAWIGWLDAIQFRGGHDDAMTLAEAENIGREMRDE